MGRSWDMLISWSNPNIDCKKLHFTREAILKVNWSFLLHLAEENKVLFFLSKNLSKVPQLKPYVIDCLKKESDHRSKLLRKLSIFINLLEKERIDFMVIKTFGPYGQVGRDIDFLIVKGKNETRRLVCDLIDMKYRVRLTDGMVYLCWRSNGDIEVDLYSALAWWGLRYLKNITVWKRKRELKIDDCSIYVPSPEDDILITCAKTLKDGILLSDLFFMSLLINEGISFDYILREAKANGWSLTLSSSLFAMNFFHKIFYKQTLIPEKMFESSNFARFFLTVLRCNLTRKKATLPYKFPIVLLLCLWIHRIWSHFLSGRIRTAINDTGMLLMQISLYLFRVVFKIFRIAYQEGSFD